MKSQFILVAAADTVWIVLFLSFLFPLISHELAYGDGKLTLQNFDAYTEEDVFAEVTGITVKDFRFLRDGGDYEDENGISQHFEGQLFDEVVFNKNKKAA